VKSLKNQIVPLMLGMLALPALAQDRWQVGVGLNFNPAETVKYEGSGTNAVFMDLKRADKWVPAIHAGYRVYDFAHSDLSVTAECQFKSSFSLTGTKNARGSQRVELSERASSRFIAPGVQWNFHRAVHFGFGLQYRFTRLESEDATVRTSYDRPWLLGYVGYTFRQGEAVKPYVALRLAASPVTTNAPSHAALAGRDGRVQLMKSLAGNAELSLQAGVRF
jgi:hypothetical protein